jgi:hypothetical protein
VRYEYLQFFISFTLQFHNLLPNCLGYPILSALLRGSSKPLTRQS